MTATSEDRIYKRKINEFDQELKRLQRELAKLKVLKRSGGRSRKQLVRSLQREMDLQAVFDDVAAEEFVDMRIEEKKKEETCCKKCQSNALTVINAGPRTIISCLDCQTRYTLVNEIAKTA